MTHQKNELKKPAKKRLALIFGIITSCLVLLILSFVFYSSFYGQKIHRNIKIAGIDVGGLEKEEAHKILNYQIDSVKNKDIILRYQDENWDIDTAEYSINYDSQASITTAYELGRSESFITNTINKIKLLFGKRNIGIAFSYDKNKIDNLFAGIAEEIDANKVNASLKIVDKKIEVTSEQIGKKVILKKLKEEMIDVITRIQPDRNLQLPVEQSEPDITEDNIQIAKNQAEIIIGQDIDLTYEDIKIEISQNKIISWLEFVAFYDRENDNYNLKTVLNNEKIKEYVNSIAGKINQRAKNARLTMSDGKVNAFQLSQDGYSLNKDQTTTLIVNALTNQIAGISTDQQNSQFVTRDIQMPVDLTKPEIDEDDIASLGIEELIGSGATSYSRSPKNRKHNIKIGAEIFHGVLIKPDEVFSFNKVLGYVSAARGFLPELVIKEDRTEPEIGGGLCQVSTTMFRTALNTGLPITERKNHKYRVSYYEPPVGLDATIYTPSPDFKFKNNTPAYILIQGYVTGSKITFEFYGTEDGRTAHLSDSELYDHTNPPPTKYIEDENMEPGTEKYLERAHKGVKAKVYYTVKRNDQIIHEQTFYSKYVAWPAVIKRGPQKEEENQEDSEENQEEHQE